MNVEKMVAVGQMSQVPGLLGPVHSPDEVLEQMREVDGDRSLPFDVFNQSYPGYIKARRVSEIMIDTLFSPNEMKRVGAPGEDVDVLDELAHLKVMVNGIQSIFGFHRDRLEAHRAEVVKMVSHLSSGFFYPTLDGSVKTEEDKKMWGLSFLVLKYDKDKVEWGGYPFAEQLLALSLGLGIAKYMVPEELWSLCPEGVPFVAFANPETGELPPDKVYSESLIASMVNAKLVERLNSILGHDNQTRG